MKLENQKEKRTFSYIPVNGIGSVATMQDKHFRDIFVYGYFTMWDRWKFFVHQDTKDPSLVTISEASTGYKLAPKSYSSVQEALHYMIPFIESKRYYFATSVNNVLVRTQTNLQERNTTNLQTIGIDTLLWL